MIYDATIAFSVTVYFDATRATASSALMEFTSSPKRGGCVYFRDTEFTSRVCRTRLLAL